MVPIRIKSKLACEMVKLEPQKLNEAVHHGHLPCAGETKPGAARIFDLNGLVMLSVFSQMLKVGMNTASAGNLACKVHSALVRDPEQRVENVVIYFDSTKHDAGDYPIRFCDENMQPVDEETPEEQMAFSLLFASARIIFPVDAMRKLGQSALNYQLEKHALGEE